MDGYALIDTARSGVENMALDQRLLETAAERQCVLLRVYRWSEPTLSLGYFQPYAQRQSHAPSSQIPVVRRATGGGAIVHHFDWTYCIAVPQTWSLTRSGNSRGTAHDIGASQPLYDVLHDAVVQWLNDAGFAARKWSQECDVAGGTQSADQIANRRAAFLCFERRSCGDVVWGEQKVMGSAQRRMPGAVLQHGSLLLGRSPHAPSLAGLEVATTEEQTRELQVQATGGQISGGGVTKVLEDYEQLGSQPLFTAEFFLQRLVQALEATAGMKLTRLESLVESPVQWHWPMATRFAETSWTERI